MCTGDKAQILFEQNKGLAYDIFHTYKNKLGIEKDDLFQECLFCLWKSALKFDENKGYEFSTLNYRITMNKIADLAKKNKIYKKIFFQESTNRDRIIEGSDELTQFDSLGEEDENIYAVLEKLDSEKAVKKLKKKYGQDVDSAMTYLNLRDRGFSIPSIETIMGTTGNDIRRIRRRIEVMRNKSHNFYI